VRWAGGKRGGGGGGGGEGGGAGTMRRSIEEKNLKEGGTEDSHFTAKGGRASWSRGRKGEKRKASSRMTCGDLGEDGGSRIGKGKGSLGEKKIQWGE